MSKYSEKKERQAKAAFAANATRPRKGGDRPLARRGDALTEAQIGTLARVRGLAERAAALIEEAKAGAGELFAARHYAKGVGGAVRMRLVGAANRVNAALATIDRAAAQGAGGLHSPTAGRAGTAETAEAKDANPTAQGVTR